MNRIFKLLFLAVFAMILQPGSAQRMKGKVSSFRESYYLVKDNFGKLKPGTKINDSVYHDRFVAFDPRGNISEMVEFNADGSTACKFKGSNDYPDNHFETLFAKFDPEVTIDRKAFIVESVKYSSGEFCEMSYKNDSLGRPFEEIIYDLMGREIYKITFIRDHTGRLIENDFSNGTVERYKYDSQGNIKELNSRHLNSKPTMTSYEYDESGNIIEMSINNYFKTTFKFQYENYTYKYQFDKNGNWTERIVFEGGKPQRMIVRTIEYSS